LNVTDKRFAHEVAEMPLKEGLSETRVVVRVSAAEWLRKPQCR